MKNGLNINAGIYSFIPGNFHHFAILLIAAIVCGFLLAVLIFGAREKRMSQHIIKRQVFNDHIYPIWIYNTQTLKILAANKAFCRKFGYPERQLKRMTILDLRYKTQQSKVKTFLDNLKAYRLPFSNTGLWIYKKKNGAIFRMEVCTLFSGNDHTRAVIGVDIDEVVDLQEQLKNIAWMQSHIVRRPLANILSLSDLMMDPRVPEKEKNLYMLLLRQSCYEMDDIIKDIVSKTDTHKSIMQGFHSFEHEQKND